MVAMLVANLERLYRRDHFGPPQRQPVRGVICDCMAALLRFQQQRKRGVAADIDPLDRVHLYGNAQTHHWPENILLTRAPRDRVTHSYQKPRGYDAEAAEVRSGRHQNGYR